MKPFLLSTLLIVATFSTSLYAQEPDKAAIAFLGEQLLTAFRNNSFQEFETLYENQKTDTVKDTVTLEAEQEAKMWNYITTVVEAENSGVNWAKATLLDVAYEPAANNGAKTAHIRLYCEAENRTFTLKLDSAPAEPLWYISTPIAFELQ
ncbi:MAG: hypothetical protein CL843_14830 [Crocinitomicaceae bacterium]|nr:hypothetical protein [Crocinitomicaceae bacterium]|tara:strand:+ start:10462 stop:10911 length:450 start_codon:yes stop_codon:yes gene_type:complete